VAERMAWTRSAIAVKIGRLRGADRVRYLDMPLLELSSSMVRRRAAKGRPVRYLVPDRVADYIRSKGLYGASVPASAS
jgi:nicotinate-nucleotide adenylyltransferase